VSLEGVLPEPIDLLVAMGLTFGLISGPFIAIALLASGSDPMHALLVGSAITVGFPVGGLWAGVVIHTVDRLL